MDFFGTGLELKAVDLQRRVISGWAAAHHNIDRVKDIIDPAASAKATRRLVAPSDVAVFVGHQSNQLPVGIPQRIEATPRGLYTETYVLKGPAGDNLLAVAKDLQDHGQPLGMSIGYRTHDSKNETTARGRVRRILDYELKEYSFAAHHTVANPDAVVTDVKARRKALTEGSDTSGGALVPEDRKGGAMQYRVEQRGDRWAVLADADQDGDEDDGRLVGTYASQDVANQVAAALRTERGGDDDDDQEEGEGKTAMATDKVMKEQHDAKAPMSAADQNDLPDSAFLYIEAGGQKDDTGRTVPRGKRHLPYKDAEGGIDQAHLRNAIGRLGQDATLPGLDEGKKRALQARARALLEKAGGGDGSKAIDPEAEGWQTGSPLAIRGMAYRLLDLSAAVADEHKAMALLGEETKDGHRIRANGRDALRAVAEEIGRLVDHAERIDRGEDGAARVAWYRQQLALTQV